MNIQEWKALQARMEIWEKRRKRLGEYNADCEDILILGQTLLDIIRGMQEKEE